MIKVIGVGIVSCNTLLRSTYTENDISVRYAETGQCAESVNPPFTD